MALPAITTAKPPSAMARGVQRVRQTIQGVSEAWFGPMQPLRPQAPEDTKGRIWDYPTAFNLNYQPRANQFLSFPQLKSLADNCGILRSVIETRKDTVEALSWNIHPRKVANKTVRPTGDMQARIDSATKLFSEPSKDCDWPQFLRGLLEQHFVFDAPSIEFVRNRAGFVCALKALDGATIGVRLDADGGTPAPPNVAYQQVLKGMPAVNFTSDELLYYPRNRRPGNAYGFPHVAQIYQYVQLSLLRIEEQVVAYKGANAPHGVMEAAATMTVDQITAMQEYWNSMFRGQTENRAMTWWVPAGSKYTALSREILFDEFDEWLARVICYCFSINPTPFIKANNRATAQVGQDTAHAEGTKPTITYFKRLFDRIIAKQLMSPDLEFVWDGEAETDPEKQANILVKYASAGIKTIDEVREEIGDDAFGGAAATSLVLTAQGYVPVDPQERTDMATEAATKTAQVAPPGFQIGPDGKPMKPPPPQIAGGPPGAAGAGPGKPPPRPGLPGQRALGGPPKASQDLTQNGANPGQKPPPGKVAKAETTDEELGLFEIARPLVNAAELIDWVKSIGLTPVAYPQLSFLALRNPGKPLPFVLVEDYRPSILKTDDGFFLYFSCDPLLDEADAAGAMDGESDWRPSILISQDKELPSEAVTAAPFSNPLLFGPQEITKRWDDAAFAAREPTEAQAEAGNYKKGHLTFQGLSIAIETPMGATRKWSGGEVEMPAHYGYIKGTLGADGDALDVYLGPNEAAPMAYVIDQHHTDTGNFDEHKIMLGYDSWTAARKAYQDAFTDGKHDTRVGNAAMLTMQQLKHWIATGDTTRPMGVNKGVTVSMGLAPYDQGPVLTPKKPIPNEELEEDPSAVGVGNYSERSDPDKAIYKNQRHTRWMDY